jgi:hypothetical protein
MSVGLHCVNFSLEISRQKMNGHYCKIGEKVYLFFHRKQSCPVHFFNRRSPLKNLQDVSQMKVLLPSILSELEGSIYVQIELLHIKTACSPNMYRSGMHLLCTLYLCA